METSDLASPVVSVIMGAYNCADTMDAAIESVRSQSMHDWELIICDDGSEDETYALASHYEEIDPRIRVISHTPNRGLAPALNRCLEHARGQYVARMDADDTCSSERFAKQLTFLTQNPHIAFVSCAINFVDESGVWGRSLPESRPTTKSFLRGNPYAHGAVMARMSELLTVGGYCEAENRWRVEDYDLWLRMHAKGFRGANLQEVLYNLQNDGMAAARRSARARRNEARVAWQAGRTHGSAAAGALAAIRPIVLSVLPQTVYRLAYRRLYRISDVPGAMHKLRIDS